MAKKVKSEIVRTAAQGNPFYHIGYNKRDFQGLEVTGGGSKLFVDVDSQYRMNLVGDLDRSFSLLASETSDYPDSLKTIVFKLRDEAIAKSHRPSDLAKETNLEIAGHGKINEMLVAAHSASYDRLRTAILTRKVKHITNNLSAIESIEPWSVDRKSILGVNELSKFERLIVRLFKYRGDEANVKNKKNFRKLLDTLSVEHEEIDQPRNVVIFVLKNIQSNNRSDIENIIKFPGVKSVYPDPVIKTEQSVSNSIGSELSSLPDPTDDLPIVAVFDTGVSSKAAAIHPWLVGKDIYVLSPDTDHVHGTMVSSLIVNAKYLNDDHEWLTGCHSLIYDVVGLESGGSNTSILIERLREAVEKRPDIKVWNLSLGGNPYENDTFSDFAIALDQLSDEYNVLFVVASGNYLDDPIRTWPINGSYLDVISSPSESVRSLTVGSIAHLDASDAYVKIGEPTPYSRRGPGPVFTPKPDVVHSGGGVHKYWDVGTTSLKVLGPDNKIHGNFGTSFSAPVIASLAANTWSSLEGHFHLSPTPSLVKALIIHSAQLNSPHYAASDRRYYGAGRPHGVLSSLYDSDDSFTLVFKASLLPGGRWRKDNYPIPSSLIEDGKFKGEIIITATYSPPVDPNAGSEYVRANVEISFGTLDSGGMKGKVPLEGEKGTDGYESAQIEHGGKWSPVKIHRQQFPKGTAGDIWALQAKVTLRAHEPVLLTPLDVNIIVTIRSLDGNKNVHADGVRALNQTNWDINRLSNKLPIQV
ncbi:S8 family anti-phage peptidase IteS [Erwinia billingiae]|uniref:S8 family anti-phage peptidase IteS n=1 Tax=Erwinia billingiae TaxID=182337 RepID=UPI00092D5E23|nr:S8 family anti-phage peptidase IteS [Erwinia billingiae]